MRELSKEKILERFQKHQKLHRFEVDTLFDVKNLTDIQYRYLEIGIRDQGIFDIETSDFNPNQNFIIGYCFTKRDILTGKLEKFEDAITKRDIKKAVKNDNFDFDLRLLENLSTCISSCNQIVGHFSTKFDTPYFRTRCLLVNRPDLIPDYSQIYQGDTWRMMKSSMKAPRNTLKNLAIYTATPDQKTFVDYEHWRRIYFGGNPKWDKSMKYIMDHCRADVAMTVKALKKIEKFNNIQRTLV